VAVAPDGTWSFSPALTVTGAYTMHVIAFDFAGNGAFLGPFVATAGE
jgi:hypothetical protein